MYNRYIFTECTDIADSGYAGLLYLPTIACIAYIVKEAGRRADGRTGGRSGEVNRASPSTGRAEEEGGFCFGGGGSLWQVVGPMAGGSKWHRWAQIDTDGWQGWWTGGGGGGD